VPVPSVITDLNSTAASNSPADTEQRTTADDYIRALSAFVRQNYDTLIGGQFVFPAAQNASGNANTLDDYEETTFTPGVTFGGGSTGITYNAQGGRAVKVGKKVTAQFNITLTSKGSSTGAAKLTGFPFTTVTSDARGGGAFLYWVAMSGLTGVPTVMMESGGTGAFLYFGSDTGVVALEDTNFTNTSAIIGVVTYEASA
jgi:hypothetical protein